MPNVSRCRKVPKNFARVVSDRCQHVKYTSKSLDDHQKLCALCALKFYLSISKEAKLPLITCNCNHYFKTILLGIPYVTDCVMAELEKLGPKYRVALRIVKDPRFERLPCMHKGTYADDCLVQRVTQVRHG